MSELTLPPVRYTRTSDGVSIAYMVWPGESPPFVRVFSPGGAPMAVQARVRASLPPVAEGRRTVSFDYRGTGQSDRRPATSMGEFVLDLRAVVHALGEPPDLGATNAGCFPACSFAAQHPEACRSLFLADPMVRISDSPQRTFLRDGYDDYDLYLYSLARTFFPNLPEDELDRFVGEWAREVPEPVFRTYLALQVAADLSTTLPSIRVPVLVYKTLPSSASGRVASLILGGVLVEREYGRRRLRADWDEYIGSRFGDTPQAAATIPTGLLTEQQRRVLALIAEGRSNLQIAEALTIAEATVKSHVRNILTKLELSNRVEAATWWVQRR